VLKAPQILSASLWVNLGWTGNSLNGGDRDTSITPAGIALD